MNKNTVFINLTNKANTLNQDAMNELHNEYSNETDLKQDFNVELIDFYKDNTNKPYSMYYYGKMHLFGLGVEKDIPNAIELLCKSREIGCSQSLIELACLNKFGLYDKESYNYLLQKACQLKNSNAYYCIGWDAKEKNDVSSFLGNMEQARELENSNAIHQIGQYYHDIGEYSQAKKYYKEAISMDNQHSLLNFGVMYREGEGFKKNNKKAMELFEQASILGNIKAFVCLGGIYQEEGNDEKAKECYKKVIAEEDPLAYYNLGLIYLDEDKRKKAIQMFLNGARQGHFNSIMKLNQLGIDPNTEDDELDDVIETRTQFHNMFKNFGAYDGEW